MRYRVDFLPDGVTIEADQGISIMQAVRIAGLPLDAPCGGNGSCGKCNVRIIQNDGTSILKPACKTYIYSDMTIDLSSAAHGHRILLDGIRLERELSPIIKAVTVHVDKPTVKDLRAEWDRLKDAVSAKTGICADDIMPNIQQMTGLHKTLSGNDYQVSVLMCRNEIIDLRAPGKQICAMAYDIGTTTIVGYLLDLETGVQRAVESMLNPQSVYGADVIQRSQYALENGTKPLSDAVREALNALLLKNIETAGIEASDIYLATVVGNTCMHHLLLGISPESLVFAPYTPTVSEPLILDAQAIGININSTGKLMVLPNIAGFVGADTVAGILVTELDCLDELTLLIDIGTNGEIVLGDHRRMAACSTAAGPAFEGALIKCGMRGAEGAIDHFSLDNASVNYSVIGGTKPIGVCGSGLIDVIAQLIKIGLVDESGKIADPKNGFSGRASAFSDRIVEKDGMRCFVIAEADQAGNDQSVYVTQKDIREVQLAKGAMAAGIKLLAEKLGVNVSDIKRVLIAGAFGNYMSPQSACLISLIPKELEDRILPVGNAAGEGAKLVALNADEFERSKTIARSCGYLELAAHPGFQDMFIDELEFTR